MLEATVTTQDQMARTLERYRLASEVGVGAAGGYLLRQLKRAYTNYYTTQRYRNTIFINRSLKAAKPERKGKHWYTIVGVPSEMVVPRGQKKAVNRGLVALGWELGHFNTFIGAKISVPIAVPTAVRYSQQIGDAFGRAVKRMLEAK